jgi:hypothetical protein
VTSIAVIDGAPGAALSAPFGASGEVACGSAQSCVVAGTTQAGAAAVTEIGSAVDAVSLNVGGVRVRGTRASLLLSCQSGCSGTVTETAIIPSGRGTPRATVGETSFAVAAGQGRTVSVGLNATGRSALRAEHELNVQLAVSSRASAGAPSTVVAIRAATIGHRRSSAS